MRVYLDVSCLNRPFDDQEQLRIRTEAEAIVLILERCDRGEWQQFSSEMALIEIGAATESVRRNRVLRLLPDKRDIINLGDAIWQRGAELETLGFRAADAVHVAAAEAIGVDVFLSCDDRLCRTAKRLGKSLAVRVANPVKWLQEVDDADDA